MALEKQNMSISFGQGLDTKTDPRQVVPGKLEVLQNSRFISGNELEKRNGNQLLTTTSAGVGKGIGTFNNEVVSFDNYTLNSYVAASGVDQNKGFSQPIDVSTNYILQPQFPESVSGLQFGLTKPDIAVNGGYIIYAFNSRQYAIVDQVTRQVIVPQTDVINVSNNSNSVGIRCFALGNYFILTYNNLTTNRIEYVAIPVATPTTPNAAVSIDSINHTPVATAYDGVVNSSSTKLYLSYGAGTSIITAILSSSLAITADSGHAATNNPQTIAVWLDEVPATPKLWVSFFNATNNTVKYFILNGNTLALTLAVTLIDTKANVSNMIGHTVGGLGGSSVIYYEIEASNGTGLRYNIIEMSTLTDAGVVATVGQVVLKGGSIVSKIFQMNGSTERNYFIVVFGGESSLSVNPTYFVLNHSVWNNGQFAFGAGLNSAIPVVAKLAAGASMAPSSITGSNGFQPSSVYMVSSTKAEAVLAVATGSTISFEIAFGVYSIVDYTLDFNNGNAFQFQQMASTLNYTGGYLAMYDGIVPIENNFHIYPESVGLTATTTVGALMDAGTYSYCALYSWTDGQGKVHRSTACLPQTVTVGGGGTNSVTVTVPCCYFTEKPDQSIFVEIYRNTLAATGVFHVITQRQGVTESSRLQTEITFVDTQSDLLIQGNADLYTTGGVLSNTGGPPASGVAVYANRLFAIDAEDRNVLWYSKQVLEITPVEFSADLTFFIDPRFGPVTAIASMDDKLIIFKNNAVFYVTGQGPDNTGNNNDFSDATLVTTTCGCVDPRSVTIMPDGLMFKSNKGIWLLDRGLGTSYIGASVESFNSSHVTGSALIPNSTQVQFTLDNSTTCLMYDYFYKQWSTYLNHNAVSATVYENLFTYIDPTGHVFQENPGVYSDNGTAIFQSLTTSWLSLAGLQGYQRIYRMYFLARYLSAHSVSVGIAYDFNTAIAQTITCDATALNASTGTDVEQFRINLDKQKCQAIRFTITETTDSNNTIGAGLNIEALGILIGAKLTYPKLPAVQSVTS